MTEREHDQEPEHYAYRFTTTEANGTTVTHTRRTVGWDNLDTLITRGIDRYGWRDVDYWRTDSYGRPLVESEPESEDGPYCYCGHTEGSHVERADFQTHGYQRAAVCYACGDDPEHETDPYHNYQRAD